MQYLGILVCSIMTLLANAGGLGGGGIIIPFMMIFFYLPIKECVPIANFFGFAAAFIRFCLNFKMKHPNKKERLVIDYEIIQLTMPLLYLGTLIGVRIGMIMSPLQVAVSLTIVLVYVAQKSLAKAIDIYKKESQTISTSTLKASLNSTPTITNNAVTS